MNITFTNTLTKQKEVFKPNKTAGLSLYVCGITPYDHAHIGHGRCYVSFDVLYRLLNFLGYDVTYARNFTDIDDKILKKADNEGVAYRDITNRYITSYHEAMKKLACLPPTIEPRVTQEIPEIIAFIQGLLDKQHAYVVDNDVYFDISTFKYYGKLSGRKLEDLEAGSRISVDKRKKNPGDFALWKGNDSQDFWNAPWGFGRPGWHIECSVMAKKYLGETIDIHAGGMDLTFPHHENEVAQSESLHEKPFANFWLHNAFVNINKEKMSKSLGNIISLHDIFKKFDPMVLRFFFLQHHYKTPIDFSFDELEGVQTGYKKLVNHFQDVKPATSEQFCALKTNNKLLIELMQSLCDDLNTPKCIGLIFQNIDSIKKSSELGAAVKYLLQEVLGLSLASLQENTVEITPEIQQLIDQRKQAREAKDWAKADELRDQLAALGVDVQDKKL
jgi:cysteinyl-tRNA synthetase